MSKVGGVDTQKLPFNVADLFLTIIFLTVLFVIGLSSFNHSEGLSVPYQDTYLKILPATGTSDDDDGSLPEGRFIFAFTPAVEEVSEVVSRSHRHRQLWASNLSKVAMQWLEVDSNPRPFGCMGQNTPLHHRVPYHHMTVFDHFTCSIRICIMKKCENEAVT